MSGSHFQYKAEFSFGTKKQPHLPPEHGAMELNPSPTLSAVLHDMGVAPNMHCIHVRNDKEIIQEHFYQTACRYTSTFIVNIGTKQSSLRRGSRTPSPTPNFAPCAYFSYVWLCPCMRWIVLFRISKKPKLRFNALLSYVDKYNFLTDAYIHANLGTI